MAEIEAVGVASCGPFVMQQGLIELAAPNICGGLAGPARGLPNSWTSARLEAPLRQQFARVRVENDGIAALEAERRWGALQQDGQPLDHCAYLTWACASTAGCYAAKTVTPATRATALSATAWTPCVAAAMWVTWKAWLAATPLAAASAPWVTPTLLHFL
jgi:hypothetical protein